jgi:ribosomal protein S18 acetylase RimI-like enzyme
MVQGSQCAARGNSHQLDNPIWYALTSNQANLAEASELARRFPPEITTLAGFLEATRESYGSLASLVGEGEEAALFLESAPVSPADWTIIETTPMLQMVHNGGEPLNYDGEAQELKAVDAPQMLALAELTKPGPFGRWTHELGTFLGIRRDKKVVAMVGERLRLPGYTEITAVCTHPEFSGRGYASALVAALVRRIRARDEIPFLHVRNSNGRAVALYEKLGFKARMGFCLAVLRRLEE